VPDEGYQKLYGPRAEAAGEVLEPFGFEVLEGGQELVFSDFDYVEMVMSTPRDRRRSRSGTILTSSSVRGRWHVPAFWKRRASVRSRVRRSTTFARRSRDNIIPLRALTDPARSRRWCWSTCRRNTPRGPARLSLEGADQAIDNCRRALDHCAARRNSGGFRALARHVTILQSCDALRGLDRRLRADPRRRGVRTEPALLLCERAVCRHDGACRQLYRLPDSPARPHASPLQSTRSTGATSDLP